MIPELDGMTVEYVRVACVPPIVCVDSEVIFRYTGHGIRNK